MSTTFFYKKDGNASSMRTTLNVGNNKISFLNYFDGIGGVTFQSGIITTRLNSKGQSIGIGLSCGNNTTYFGKNGNVISQLPALR